MKSCFAYWILLLAPLLTSQAAGQETGDKKTESGWHSVAQKHIAPLLEKKALSAVIVGVIDRQGKKQYVTYGDKPGTLAVLDEHTIFEIGSITKTMTSMLLADGIQKMELKLDDPIKKYLPEGMTVPQRGSKDITLEDLATHTSGFPRLPPNMMTGLITDAKARDNPYSQFDAAQLKKSLESTKPKVSDKPKVEYSNYGAGLLGYTLTQKYGKSYETLLQERLFGPLAMKSSSTIVSDANKVRFIDGFKGDGKPASHWDFQDTLGPAGSVRSTAHDMLLYLEAAMGRSKTLRPAFDLALAPQFEMNPRSQIGLAWIIMERSKKRLWWHNGGTGGFSSFAGFAREPGVGVIVLSNRSMAGGEMDQLGMRILADLMGEPAATGK